MNTVFLIFTLLFFTREADKKLQLIREIKINTPSKASIDRAGNIYVVDNTDQLYRFDPIGEFQLDYSPPKPAEITLMEAWQGLRIFLFFRDLQEYSFLNRYLANQQGNYSFINIGFVEMAAPSYDNNIWLIDQVDFSMKKYDIFKQETLSTTPFDLLLNPEQYEITFIKEYQNKVYVGDRNSGILLFDNFGNFIRKYSQPGLNSFNFYKDIIYFIDNGKIILINLYNDDHQEITLPKEGPYHHVLIFEERYYLFTDSSMQIYKLAE